MPTLWSVSLGAAVRSLSLAREAELLLARDENLTLSLLNSQGELQARTRLAGPTAGCVADDGSAVAAVGVAGQVWWVALDLTVCWERKIPVGALAVALDPFGQYLAVSDKAGTLHLFDRTATLLGQFQSPRPISHLAFVPETMLIAAAADFGWTGCLDLATGDWVWSDRPVSHIGGLAVAAHGDPLVLACFSDGIRRYGIGGSHHTPIRLPQASSLVAMSYFGDRAASAGPGREVHVLDRAGDVSVAHEFKTPPTAVAMSPLGDRLICGFVDGSIRAVSLAPVEPKM